MPPLGARCPAARAPSAPPRCRCRARAPCPAAASHAARAPAAAAALPRRAALLSLLAALSLPARASASADADADAATSAASAAASASASDELPALQAEAASAFAAQDFARAEAALSRLVALEPLNPSWLEGRAQVRVDAKAFEPAVADYAAALALVGSAAEPDAGAAARLRAGRALAYEGLARWADALADYDAALAAAAASGFRPDPYVLNSRGNVLSSLARWAEARAAFQEAAAIFQASAGYRRGASTTQRLDGAIYAASNAALVLAQLGDEAGAAAELSAVARRAPNSADARAALAALRWAAGRRAEAEEAWDSACSRAAGCRAYRDDDYVTRIRRWPPVMAAHLRAFLSLADDTPSGPPAAVVAAQ
jgi:tetratricopeptide (TPR) repeat protein